MCDGLDEEAGLGLCNGYASGSGRCVMGWDRLMVYNDVCGLGWEV